MIQRGVIMNDPFISSPAEHGQGLVEYALILVLVAVVVIIGLSLVGTSAQGVYCDVVEAYRATPPSVDFKRTASAR
jgi:pilus assembly protein Flp/PilA